MDIWQTNWSTSAGREATKDLSVHSKDIKDTGNGNMDATVMGNDIDDGAVQGRDMLILMIAILLMMLCYCCSFASVSRCSFMRLGIAAIEKFGTSVKSSGPGMGGEGLSPSFVTNLRKPFFVG